MLRETELDPFFDEARFDAFRLEVLEDYAVEVESPRLRDYLAGEPYDPEAEPKEWYRFIEDWTGRGVNFRKVHVLRGPLSEYLRFECEWSYTATERHGQRTHILDLSEAPAPPTLPNYDFWMFDERTVLKFVYDASGAFVGAERLPDSAVSAHVAARDDALAASVPFPRYWAAHPQYRRADRPAGGSA